MYDPPHRRPDYTGPFEQIKPGHVLAAERIEEYQDYMQKAHRFRPRLWGPNEDWQDTGLRPFDTLSGKHSDNQNQSTQSTEEPNPFDIP